MSRLVLRFENSRTFSLRMLHSLKHSYHTSSFIFWMTNCLISHYFTKLFIVDRVSLVIFSVVIHGMDPYRSVNVEYVTNMVWSYRSRSMRIAVCFVFIISSDPRRAVYSACIYSVVSFASTSKTMAPSAIALAPRSFRTIPSVSATGNTLITSCGRLSPCSRWVAT